MFLTKFTPIQNKVTNFQNEWKTKRKMNENSKEF